MLFYTAQAVCRSLLVLCFLLLTAFPALGGSGKPAHYPVAMRSFGVWEPHSGERFDFSVWYPGGADVVQASVPKEGWVVDYPRRGKIIPGFYPVILVSHDAASSRYANNDLAAALAAGGFIVIVPTHNGDSQNNGKDIYSAAALRNRPRQMLRALENLLENPDFSYYIDESRIGVLGIGFGSISALQLAGAAPDLDGVNGYCSRNSKSDAFCAEWSLQRLRQAAGDMPEFTRREGQTVFVPPLTLYAPMLTPANLSREVVALFENQNPEKESNRPQTVWHNLFGDENEADPGPARGESENPGDAGAVESVEPFPLELDFQGGPFFGGTSSGSPYIHIAMPDSPEFRAGVGESFSSDMPAPPASQEGPDDSAVYRRPPDVRRIKGIALMVPAGGMLFSPQSLSAVRVPVVMIQAGKDELYPPESHAQTYYNGLPAPPLVLRLDDADHFSLFAQCSEESMGDLGDLCGRLDPDDREDAVRERNSFLLNFFQTSVGVPLAPVLPPGYIAMPGLRP